MNNLQKFGKNLFQNLSRHVRAGRLIWSGRSLGVGSVLSAVLETLLYLAADGFNIVSLPEETLEELISGTMVSAASNTPRRLPSSSKRQLNNMGPRLTELSPHFVKKVISSYTVGESFKIMNGLNGENRAFILDCLDAGSGLKIALNYQFMHSHKTNKSSVDKALVAQFFKDLGVTLALPKTRQGLSSKLDDGHKTAVKAKRNDSRSSATSSGLLTPRHGSNRCQEPELVRHVLLYSYENPMNGVRKASKDLSEAIGVEVSARRIRAIWQHYELITPKRRVAWAAGPKLQQIEAIGANALDHLDMADLSNPGAQPG